MRLGLSLLAIWIGVFCMGQDNAKNTLDDPSQSSAIDSDGVLALLNSFKDQQNIGIKSGYSRVKRGKKNLFLNIWNIKVSGPINENGTPTVLSNFDRLNDSTVLSGSYLLNWGGIDGGSVIGKRLRNDLQEFVNFLEEQKNTTEAALKKLKLPGTQDLISKRKEVNKDLHNSFESWFTASQKKLECSKSKDGQELKNEIKEAFRKFKSIIETEQIAQRRAISSIDSKFKDSGFNDLEILKALFEEFFGQLEGVWPEEWKEKQEKIVVTFENLDVLEDDDDPLSFHNDIKNAYEGLKDSVKKIQETQKDNIKKLIEKLKNNNDLNWEGLCEFVSKYAEFESLGENLWVLSIKEIIEYLRLKKLEAIYSRTFIEKKEKAAWAWDLGSDISANDFKINYSYQDINVKNYEIDMYYLLEPEDREDVKKKVEEKLIAILGPQKQKFFKEYFYQSDDILDKRFRWVVGGEFKYGRETFDFLDDDSLEKKNRKEGNTKWSAFTGWTPKGLNNTVFSLTYSYQRYHASQSAVELCSPLEDHNGFQTCGQAIIGAPDSKREKLLSLEYRTKSKRFGFAPKATWNFETDQLGMGVPFYFITSPEKELVGGLSLDYITRNKRDEQPSELRVGFFVGSAFKLGKN